MIVHQCISVSLQRSPDFSPGLPLNAWSVFFISGVRHFERYTDFSLISIFSLKLLLGGSCVLGWNLLFSYLFLRFFHLWVFMPSLGTSLHLYLNHASDSLLFYRSPLLLLEGSSFFLKTAFSFCFTNLIFYLCEATNHVFCLFLWCASPLCSVFVSHVLWFSACVSAPGLAVGAGPCDGQRVRPPHRPY